jgi:hypothetical protein
MRFGHGLFFYKEAVRGRGADVFGIPISYRIPLADRFPVTFLTRRSAEKPVTDGSFSANLCLRLVLYFPSADGLFWRQSYATAPPLE